MKLQNQLGLAIKLATDTHHGQTDKQGMPYILHPLHLMHQLMFDTELATIAVLHDAVEDSELTFEDLDDMGFSKRVISALKLLTHDMSDSYEEYIAKMCAIDLGIDDSKIKYDVIRVKRKDLEHNSDITRLKGITERDINRIEKYHKAFVLLGKAKHRIEFNGWIK